MEFVGIAVYIAAVDTADLYFVVVYFHILCCSSCMDLYMLWV